MLSTKEFYNSFDRSFTFKKSEIKNIEQFSPKVIECGKFPVNAIRNIKFTNCTNVSEIILYGNECVLDAQKLGDPTNFEFFTGDNLFFVDYTPFCQILFKVAKIDEKQPCSYTYEAEYIYIMGHTNKQLTLFLKNSKGLNILIKEGTCAQRSDLKNYRSNIGANYNFHTIYKTEVSSVLYYLYTREPEKMQEKLKGFLDAKVSDYIGCTYPPVLNICVNPESEDAFKNFYETIKYTGDSLNRVRELHDVDKEETIKIQKQLKNDYDDEMYILFEQSKREGFPVETELPDFNENLEKYTAQFAEMYADIVNGIKKFYSSTEHLTSPIYQAGTVEKRLMSDGNELQIKDVVR